MANNRMVLVCNVCIPKENEWTSFTQKGILTLAKWYPESLYHISRDIEEIDNFLKEHNHPEVKSEHYSKGAGQENPVRIEYESIGKPLLE